jgi:hypothetical protein
MHGSACIYTELLHRLVLTLLAKLSMLVRVYLYNEKLIHSLVPAFLAKVWAMS